MSGITLRTDNSFSTPVPMDNTAPIGQPQTGGGVNGTLAFRPQGNGAIGFAVDLAARNASFGGTTPINITRADIAPILIGGFAVAMVSFADTSVLSRVYAARTRTYVDPNQEMVGLGVANLASNAVKMAVTGTDSRFLSILR